VMNDYSAAIQELCKKSNLPCYFRGHELGIQTAYTLAVSWRWMLPAGSDTIIFHDSPLTRYRGFAPMVNQLIQGENEIAVTALFAAEEFDKGHIITCEKLPIEYPITIQEAIEKSLGLYSTLACQIIEKIASGAEIEGTPQNENHATYSLWRDAADYAVDWSEDANYLQRFVDATGFPFLGAKARLNGEKITISKVRALEEDVFIHNRDIGKVLFIKDERPVVVCGQGLLHIIEAFYCINKESIFPLGKFRSRFS
jgi:methionyl-tRNA formyltransferase